MQFQANTVEPHKDCIFHVFVYVYFVFLLYVGVYIFTIYICFVDVYFQYFREVFLALDLCDKIIEWYSEISRIAPTWEPEKNG